MTAELVSVLGMWPIIFLSFISTVFLAHLMLDSYDNFKDNLDRLLTS